MSRKAKPGLDLSITCKSAGQKEPLEGSYNDTPVRSEAGLSLQNSSVNKEWNLEPRTKFLCVWTMWNGRSHSMNLTQGPVSVLLLISRSSAAHVSVCRSKTISFVKLAHTQNFTCQHKNWPQHTRGTHGKYSTLNAFSILRNMGMFSLPCQETSFFMLTWRVFFFLSLL